MKINFQAIARESKRIRAQYDRRVKIIDAAFKSGGMITAIPRDYYAGQRGLGEDSYVVEKRHKDLSIDVMTRETLALAELKNALTALEKLQRVFAEKNRQYEQLNPSKDFLNAADVQVQRTKAKANKVYEIMLMRAMFLEGCGRPLPEINGDTTKYCISVMNSINPDAAPVSLIAIQNAVIERMCFEYNTIANCNIEIMDIEIGYLKYCDSSLRTDKVLLGRQKVFIDAACKIDQFLGESLLWQHAIQQGAQPQGGIRNKRDFC